MVYAAESVALAVLEVRVHLDLPWDLIPDDYVVVTIETSSCSSEDVVVMPPDTVVFGDRWLASRRSSVLRVPSFVAPSSTNVLIDPSHPDSGGIIITTVRPFSFDRRLWPSP